MQGVRIRMSALVLVIAALFALFFTSCSAKSEQPSAAAGTTGDQSQNLLIYTGRDKDEVDVVLGLFQEKFPKYRGKVSAITLGAQAAVERLRAERDNPQAGFLWGGTLQGLQQLSNDGLLVPSAPANINLLEPSRRDPQGRWFAEMLLPEVIIYNHDLLKPDQAPKEWDDLIKPEYKGKIVIRDVMPSGTMRTIFSAMILIHSVNGSPDAGYEWLRKLDGNTLVYAATPDDMYLKLDRGVGVITLWNLQDALIQPLRNHRPWSYVIPDSGVPVLLDGVGLVNNPKSAQAALDFENFLLEPELQLKLAKDYYQIPALQLPDGGKPEWLAQLKLKEMKIDWELLGQKESEWMDYWSQKIKGKSRK